MQSEPLKYYYSRFRLFLFRSPLLKESIFLSFPVGTKMFQFPTFPPHVLLYLYMGNWSFFTNCVSTFRHLWINGYLLLPIAFRSLSRLSSALDAKAFTLRSQQLNLITLVIQFKMFTKLHLSSFRFNRSYLFKSMLVLPINYFRINLYIFQCAAQIFYI